MIDSYLLIWRLLLALVAAGSVALISYILIGLVFHEEDKTDRDSDNFV